MSPRSRFTGLSLVEIMVALAVLVVATLALVSVRTYLLQAQQKTHERQTASFLGASLMSEVEAAVKEDFDRDLLSSLTVDVSGWPDGFSYALDQSREGPDLQRVEVVIAWQDRNGDQEFRLWTKFAREV